MKVRDVPKRAAELCAKLLALAGGANNEPLVQFTAEAVEYLQPREAELE